VRRYSRVDGEFVHELTMPLGTFCLEIPEGEKYGYYVGVARLWHSVLEQLASEYVAQYRAALGKHEKLLRHAAANQPELVGMIKETRPHPLRVPKPVIFSPLSCEYECEHCGRRFLSHRIHGNGIPLCSNACESVRSNRMQRKRREENPPDYFAINAARFRKRAEARAGRMCEHCGMAVEATRSTKRFCSDICRIRAHHRRARQARISIPRDRHRTAD
jgi:hypothetical protein